MIACSPVAVGRQRRYSVAEVYAVGVRGLPVGISPMKVTHEIHPAPSLYCGRVVGSAVERGVGVGRAGRVCQDRVGQGRYRHRRQVGRGCSGAPVFQGSSLRTGPASALGVTFRDNTVMSFGPDTELTVDEYLYQPTQNQGRLGTRISKGTLNYVSGAIARVRPDAVSVTTPTGTIGVRGTQFLLKVD